MKTVLMLPPDEMFHCTGDDRMAIILTDNGTWWISFHAETKLFAAAASTMWGVHRRTLVDVAFKTGDHQAMDFAGKQSHDWYCIACPDKLKPEDVQIVAYDREEAK